VTEVVRVEAVTPARWADVERLAGDRGFSGGCWCMWWRVTSREWDERHGDGLRSELQALVRQGDEPGLVAYMDDEPVGWVALAPRSAYPRLNRSPKLKPVDDRPVWSITCFYIDRHHRRQGVAEALLRAAVSYAAEHGAEAVEAYPIDTSSGSGSRRASADLYMGTLAMFERAGFTEVARRAGRPIVRSHR
jgi:ribosomal protein S18 acetylase RimI-like enzyme